MLEEQLRDFRMVRGTQVSTIQVKKLDAYAKVPTYGSSGAAGMDLYANFGAQRGSAIEPHGYGLDPHDDYYDLFPGERKLFKTGISIAIPRGTYARVAPRSGLAYKNGIDVMAGVIDEDYRGDVGVILINHGAEPFRVRHGDRIAQLIVTLYLPCLAVETDELSDTNRGSAGFGSTGK